MAAVWPHSIRYGREVGTTMLIYIMGLAYAASSPIILPFALAFFIMSWCEHHTMSLIPYLQRKWICHPEQVQRDHKILILRLSVVVLETCLVYGCFQDLLEVQHHVCQ